MVDRARSKDKRIENVRDPRKIVPHEIEMKVSHAVETNCTFLSALFPFRCFLSKFHTRTVAFIFRFSYTTGSCYRRVKSGKTHGRQLYRSLERFFVTVTIRWPFIVRDRDTCIICVL